jgi:hypothetical protein
MTTIVPIGKYPHIQIKYDEKNDPTFGLTATEALKIIDDGPLGSRMLDDIEKAPITCVGGYKVCIMKYRGDGPQGDNDGSSKTDPCAHANAVFSKEEDGVPGVGCASVVRWIPNQWVTPDGKRPPFIGLAHELVHAWNNALGTAVYDKSKNEKIVTGLLSSNNNAVTENSIRTEHKIGPRTSYSGI